MSKALEQITDDLYLLALDYRSAAPGDARDKWLELEAFVAGLVAKGDQWKHDAINGSNYLREKLAAVEAERDALKAELAAERERCAAKCAADEPGISDYERRLREKVRDAILRD